MGLKLMKLLTELLMEDGIFKEKKMSNLKKNYSEFIGCKHTIGCANGLDALIWIFRAYIEMGVMMLKVMR